MPKFRYRLNNKWYIIVAPTIQSARKRLRRTLNRKKVYVEKVKYK